MSLDLTTTSSEEKESTFVYRHNQLKNRELPDQHPIEAISGWVELTKEDIETFWNKEKGD